jgi:hypothetical protein
LTPTQWLFGRDAFKKIQRASTIASLGSHLKGSQQLAMTDAATTDRTNAGGWRGSRSPGASDTDVRATVRTVTTVPTAGAAGAPGASSGSGIDASTQRYLVEEWRAAELEVADSVHHSNLERIFAAFQAMNRSRLSDEQRKDVLSRLDRLNQINTYSWIKFRIDIIREADSLLAH